MAQTVHLKLQIDGDDIEGESTVVSMNRDDTIECLSFHYAVKRQYDPQTFRTIKGSQHEPVVIYKRIDKSTPLLLKALCKKKPVNSAEFRFFRLAISGTGAEEHFFTVLLENGFICSVEQVSEDIIMAGIDAPPMIEEVAFTFKDITWTHEISRTSHKETLR